MPFRANVLRVLLVQSARRTLMTVLSITVLMVPLAMIRLTTTHARVCQATPGSTVIKKSMNADQIPVNTMVPATIRLGASLVIAPLDTMAVPVRPR